MEGTCRSALVVVAGGNRSVRPRRRCLLPVNETVDVELNEQLAVCRESFEHSRLVGVDEV